MATMPLQGARGGYLRFNMIFTQGDGSDDSAKLKKDRRKTDVTLSRVENEEAKPVAKMMKGLGQSFTGGIPTAESMSSDSNATAEQIAMQLGAPIQRLGIIDAPDNADEAGHPATGKYINDFICNF